MLNEFFDKIVVLTTSRRKRCEAELDKYGIKAEFVQSIEGVTPFHSFNVSMSGIIKEFSKSELGNILVLEDDVVFQNMQSLDMCLDELLIEFPNWDMLYLGGNYKNHDQARRPDHISDHLRRIYNAWTTHAVAYRRDVAAWIVRNYKVDQMYDAFLDERVLGKFKAIATYPLFAIQEKGHSGLWGHEVDYSGAWSQSTDFIR
jgi:GR25 family glycosyltransferase involved in LPS biosynthesis